MSKFKKKNSSTPMISTASLPDIVFMLLFFFMVTTKLRETDMLVLSRTPQASQLQKLEKKSLISTIYVGKPKDTQKFGTEPRIQLNDALAATDAIPNWVLAERADMPESDRDKLTVSLKVDREAKMGIVTDVKQKLRDADALKLNYSCSKKMDE